MPSGSSEISVVYTRTSIMDRTVFNGLFKDLMTHIHDFAALETHALAQVLDVPENYHGGRGHYIRQLVLEEIERFRPAGESPEIDAIEWRPYLILHKRYAEGVNLQELADYLAISKRQMRRDHSKALQALAGRLWDGVFRQKLDPAPNGATDSPAEGSQTFEVHPEPLSLAEVLQGVVRILRRHLETEGVQLHLETAAVSVLTDRVILRQILISLFNYAIHLQSDNRLRVQVRQQGGQAQVIFHFAVDRQWADLAGDESDDLLGSARFWGTRLNAALEETHPPAGESGNARLTFSMPAASQPVILVVDDQQPTLRMYRRYLSRSNFKVVGVDDPHQVFPLVEQLQPALILLDVMMPQVDGWEILQNLQLNEACRHIPVIVCSAWESADLALSLGAAAFLKKPITQEQLRAAIREVGL